MKLWGGWWFLKTVIVLWTHSKVPLGSESHYAWLRQPWKETIHILKSVYRLKAAEPVDGGEAFGEELAQLC